MTRLKTEDIRQMPDALKTFDRDLKSAIGLSLKDLAGRAAGLGPSAMEQRITGCRVCAVPVTSGRGVIDSFCETLCAIASHLGFDAFISGQTDIAGLSEAFEKKTDIVLASDDHRFVAIHLERRQVVDNSQATGKGFAFALAQMAGGLTSRPLLVIGCGPVGQHAALTAAELGARVTLCDLDRERCLDFSRRHRHCAEFSIADSLPAALRTHDLIIDATPAADIIDVETLGPATLIAAPGVPCGVSAAGRKAIGPRLLWDALRIGVSVMLMEAVACSGNDTAESPKRVLDVDLRKRLYRHNRLA